jgi:hypothetical protein
LVVHGYEASLLVFIVDWLKYKAASTPSICAFPRQIYLLLVGRIFMFMRFIGSHYRCGWDESDSRREKDGPQIIPKNHD